MKPYPLRPTSALRAEGWTQRRLAHALGAGTLTRTVRGVYGAAGGPEPGQAHLARARAILLRKRGDAVLSHVSAALAHGLPVAQDDPAVVHLCVAPPARGRRRSGYHVHVADLTDADVVILDGLAVTSLARTVTDLALFSSFTWGVVAMDAALRRGVEAEEIQSLVTRSARRPGVETLRTVVAFADARAESPLESISRVSMARAGIPTPELQVQVLNEGGWVATSDFGWPEFGVVGEADGAGKFAPALAEGQSPEQAVQATLARDELIRQAGWWPSHWGWQTARDAHRLGEQLRSALQAGGALRRAS